MGRKMSKPPIFYTIGLIQFSPVLGMAKFVPEIQESVRAEFPDFRQEKTANLQIRLAGESAPGPVMTQSDRWHFINQDKTSGYILRPETLVFHTTAYETSEHFLNRVIEGITVVNKLANLSYVESVAIRTLDAVIPDPDLKVGDYLNPAVRGLAEGLAGHLKQSVMESLWEIPPSGLLISRVTITKGSLAFPMDLFPLSLEVNPDLRNLDVHHALLDNDRQEKQRFKFSLEEIQKRFLTVKQGATEAFEKEVSQLALERWK